MSIPWEWSRIAKAWTSLPNWVRLGLQGLLVFSATWLFAYAIMLIANLRPLTAGTQCPWQFPKILSCLLGTNLAGGVVGAGGAGFVAWVAWKVVQHQLRHTMMVERAYISGGGAPGSDEPNLFVLTVQNYGKTSGTVTEYAVSVVDRADLPTEPAYLKPEYIRTPYMATFSPVGRTVAITEAAIPPLAPNPIAYGRLWYRDAWGSGKYHFSFILPLLTPDDHTCLVDISKEYTSST